jgi:hypothetical protein
LGLIAAIVVAWRLICLAVRHEFRIPWWLPWPGLVLAAIGFAIWLFIYKPNDVNAGNALAAIVAGTGLVISLLSLTRPHRWATPCGIALGAAPLLSAVITMPMIARMGDSPMPEHIVVRLWTLMFAIGGAWAVGYLTRHGLPGWTRSAWRRVWAQFIPRNWNSHEATVHPEPTKAEIAIPVPPVEKLSAPPVDPFVPVQFRLPSWVVWPVLGVFALLISALGMLL